MAKIRQMRPEERLAEEIFGGMRQFFLESGLSPNSVSRDPEIYEKIDMIDDAVHRKRILDLKEFSQKNESFGYDHYDNQTWTIQKRKKASLKYYPQAARVLKPLYREKDFDWEFFFSNTIIGNGGYNSLNSSGSVIKAAAVWILDQISLQEKLPELFDLIPENLPDITKETYYLKHPSYSDDLLQAVMQLILYRNEGIVKNNGINGPLLWELQEKPDLEAAPYRMAFDRVLALLDKKTLQKITKDYEEKVWEFYRLAFSAKQAVATARCNIEKQFSQTDSINILRFPFSPPSISEKPSVLKYGELPGTVAGEYGKERALINFDARVGAIYNDLAQIAGREKYATEMEDIFGSELAERIRQFSVEDPFETIFALFYLLDQGSSIPWLYYGSIAVAYTAVDQLPFEIMPHKLAEEQQEAPFTQAVYQRRFRGAKYPNQKDANGELVDRKLGLNLGQLLYAETYGVLPRVVSKLPDLEETLSQLETDPNTTQQLYTLLVQYMRESLFTPEDLESYRLEKEKEQQKDTALPEVSADVLLRQLQEMKRENSNLRQLLHEVQDSRKKDAKTQEVLIQENRDYQQELSELRALVYQINSQEPEQESVPVAIEFPYATKERRILSFGGHSSWLKAIRVLLPDVRFVSPDELPNRELIRNADEIWLQTNCISHSDYYTIIDIAHNSNIKLHYFQYASAEKCAKQVVSQLLDTSKR